MATDHPLVGLYCGCNQPELRYEFGATGSQLSLLQSSWQNPKKASLEGGTSKLGLGVPP